MATSTYPAMGAAVDNTSAATFIPEIWSDEIIAGYEKSLVLANLVKKMAMTGKKGDTLHIPKPTRGSANIKHENAAVTIQNDVEDEVLVTVNKHFEYSRLIEDITEVQALASLRQFYTGDAGYALARQVDLDLFTLGKSLGDGDGTDFTHSASFNFAGSNGIEAYAEDAVADGDVFNDKGFRALIQKLDDADAPMDGRSLVVPPSVRNEIMGIDRYMSSDFVDGRGVRNGLIGNLYGIDIFVSSNCPIIETAAQNGAGGDVKQAMLMHTDAMVLAEQQAIRSQTQYKQEFLGTLFTADTLYGVQVLRPNSALVIAVNG